MACSLVAPNVTFAFFGANEFRADNAVLVTVKENKCVAGPAGGFEVRVVL